MQLSLRLSAIADLVTEGNRLVDVGCDHGYLPVYLIQQKKIPSAIAMDVRKGPLSRAQEHIRQYGLEEYIQTRLSDGLEGLKAGEGDTLVIAGMGGPLMERILTDGRSVRNSFSELILQPQSDIPHFRRFIQSEGWEITEEKMVEEDGKFYPMMNGQKCRKIQLLTPWRKPLANIFFRKRTRCFTVIFSGNPGSAPRFWNNWKRHRRQRQLLPAFWK